MVDWFRIETNVYPSNKPMKMLIKQVSPRIFVFRVVSYKVHPVNLEVPTKKSKGIQNLKNIAAKEYNYIHTGQNKDIINFDINFNPFFTSIAGDFGQKTSDSLTSKVVQKFAGNKVASLEQQLETLIVQKNPKTNASGKHRHPTDGGGPMVHPESVVARNFNEALMNSPSRFSYVRFGNMGRSLLYW